MSGFDLGVTPTNAASAQLAQAQQGNSVLAEVACVGMSRETRSDGVRCYVFTATEDCPEAGISMGDPVRVYKSDNLVDSQLEGTTKRVVHRKMLWQAELLESGKKPIHIEVEENETYDEFCARVAERAAEENFVFSTIWIKTDEADNPLEYLDPQIDGADVKVYLDKFIGKSFEVNVTKDPGTKARGTRFGKPAEVETGGVVGA